MHTRTCVFCNASVDPKKRSPILSLQDMPPKYDKKIPRMAFTVEIVTYVSRY